MGVYISSYEYSPINGIKAVKQPFPVDIRCICRRYRELILHFQNIVIKKLPGQNKYPHYLNPHQTGTGIKL